MNEHPNSGPTLVLQRHGQISANKSGHWHGSTDTSLTFTGRRQAKKTARFLNRHESIHRIVTSPLKRCRETAEHAGKELGLEVEPHGGLTEMSIGEWEAMAFKELHERFDLFTKLETDQHFTPPGGESLTDVSTRMLTAFAEVAHGLPSDATILVVTHGVAIASALSQILHGSPCRWRDYNVANCSLTRITLDPEPVVLSFNQQAHL